MRRAPDTSMIQIALPQARRKARIEIVPLIDIIFFLLATFVLVSMSMVKNQGVPIRLPVASTGKSIEQGETMIARISQDGAVFLNKQEYVVEALPQALEAFKNGQRDPKVIIQGDRDASYGNVIAVLDAVRKAGISKVAVQTTRKSS